MQILSKSNDILIVLLKLLKVGHLYSKIWMSLDFDTIHIF